MCANKLGMKGTTLEFLPLLDSISYSTDYKIYEQEVSFELEQIIKARTFSIKTPVNWDLTEDFSSCDYVGRIEGEGVCLFFEQGLGVFEDLEAVIENENIIYYERLIIDGADAVIHKEYCERSRSNILSIYLEKGILKNKIYVFNASQEKNIIKLFKTHRFTK